METVSSNISSEHENTESIPGEEATTSAGNNTIITLIRFFLFFVNPQFLQTVRKNEFICQQLTNKSLSMALIIRISVNSSLNILS